MLPDNNAGKLLVLRADCVLMPVSARSGLLPLNGRGRFAGDIVGYAGDAIDLVDDAARDVI